jgi:hypothetical protein
MFSKNSPRTNRKEWEVTPKELNDLAKWIKKDQPQMPDDQVPNRFEKFWDLSMFFIQDFGLESMKTFKNRKWWKLVVWQAEQSVEMIPNDTVIKKLQADANLSWSWDVTYSTTLDFSVNTGTPRTSESPWKQWLLSNDIEIIRDWIYEVEFSYWIYSMNDITWIRVAINRNDLPIMEEENMRNQVLLDYNDPVKTFWMPVTAISSYKRKSVQLFKWDIINFIIDVNYYWSWSLVLDKDFTTRSLHYLSNNR